MSFAFPKSHHLRHQRDFDAVYGAKMAKRSGPLRIHGRPNDLPHNRLGLSIGRRVGGAVVRNRVKRLLRESFRLLQHDLPRSYDLVIVAMPHDPLSLGEYQRLLRDGVERLDREWQRRAAP